MTIILLLFFTLYTSIILFLSKPHWEEFKNKHGIRYYVKAIPGKGLRIRTNMEDLTKSSQFKDMLKRCKDIRIQK